MRIVIMQLSDLHIHNRESVDIQKIQSAINGLSGLTPFEGFVLIVSGDLASQGKVNEYKCVSHFIGSLIDGVERAYSIDPKRVKLLLIPGNHDIDWGTKRDISPDIVRGFDDIKKDTEYSIEIDRMRSYFAYSCRNGCFFEQKDGVPNGQIVTRKVLSFDSQYYIEVNLINTAPFSCDKDDGLHYLPEEAILEITKPSKANLSIVVMHHSPDWFAFQQKKQLQQIIANRCSIAFYGHEHLPGAQQVFYDNGMRVIQQCGGAWYQSALPNACDFYAATFDTNDRKYSLNMYRWDNAMQKFLATPTTEANLMHKSLDGAGLVYQEDYLSEFFKDEKYSISTSIEDYFVFPDLLTDSDREYAHSKKIANMEDAIDYINTNQYIAITGGSNSGKTMLLKILFRELSKTKYVLFCGINEITGRKQENIIKELITDTFGNASIDQFFALKKEQRAIMIDDIHRIKDTHLKKFLKGIEELFGTIIVATSETSQFDIIQLVKDQLDVEDEFRKVRISNLLPHKRLELIKKIVQLKIGESAQVSDTVRTLEICLNSYKLDFRTQVDFVVQFTSYYCEHFDELVKADASVFSKVFEASIERLIAPQLSKKHENKEDFIVAISEVAHYIHFNKEYPISGDSISKVITHYCEYYDNRYLTPDRFIEVAELSGIIKKTSCGFTYRFSDKNHLAYFVAKALNRKYHDDGDDTCLKIIVEESCFGINGDILSFLTYISDNVNIPRLILSQALSFIQDWPEFNVQNKQRYLQSINAQPLSLPSSEQKQVELENRAKEEEALLESERIETLDLYDYDAATINKLGNQLLRASLQLKTVARNLAAFISIFPAKDKKAYAVALYEIPNKIFNRWASYIDDNIDEQVDSLLEWQESDEFTGKKRTTEQYRRFFQEVSINMLLNLYYTVAVYGVNNNTAGYLVSQECAEKDINYQIEKILCLEKVDDIIPALKMLEKIYKATEDTMIKKMLNIILSHMYINSNKLPQKERRRIAATYFSPQGKTRLLIDRKKEK